MNRPNWDACARCGESLEGAEAHEPAGVTTSQPDDTEAAAGGRGFPAYVLTLVAVLALSAAAAWAWRWAKTTSPDTVDPSAFTTGTLPSPLPTAEPLARPGQREYEAGRALLAKNDVAAAVGQLAAAVAADPNDPEYRNAYAHALWRSGDHEASLDEQGAAARLDGRLRPKYARALEVAGRLDDAAREYEAVLAETPDAVIVHQDLGRLLFRGGEYAKAAVHLERAIQGRPDDPVLQQELAYALDQAGDRERATAVYREILTQSPWASTTRQYLSESLYEQGQPDEALALVRDGIARTPETPLLHRQLGSLLERSGRRAAAASAYREYARLAPSAPDAQRLVARAAALDGASPPSGSPGEEEQ